MSYPLSVCVYLPSSELGNGNKLFENERCLVWELNLAPNQSALVPFSWGSDHLLLQVGRGE